MHGLAHEEDTEATHERRQEEENIFEKTSRHQRVARRTPRGDRDRVSFCVPGVRVEEERPLVNNVGEPELLEHRGHGYR